MDDFSKEFEYSNEGREYFLENDYGYKNHKACIDCIDSIREEVENKRQDEINHYRELDFYYRKK